MSILNGKGLHSGYTKEGKGIDKNAPQKKGFFLFMDIVWNKLTDFIRLNLLYSLFSILWIAFLYMIVPITPDTVAGIVGDMEGAQYAAQSLVFGFRAVFAMVIFNLWGCAPVSSAYAYVTRSFTRGEPVWVWSDGFDKFKENIKQSLMVFIVDIIVVFMSLNAIMFYYSQYTQTNQNLWFCMCCIVAVVMFLYTIMHYYIYQIMVTFECKGIQLYKNAMLCAIAHLPMSVLHTLISVGIIVVLSFAVYPGIVIVFNFAIGLCFTRFPMEFYAARVIKKMIRQNEKKNKNNMKITYVEDK